MSSNDSIQENESIHENTQQESQKPLLEDSQESKKSRPHDDGCPGAEAEEEEEGSATGITEEAEGDEDDSGRERLKRHRVEVAGRVWIPDMWGQEDLLKDWADCASFDASLVRSSILMARDSLANQGKTPHSNGIRLSHTSF